MVKAGVFTRLGRLAVAQPRAVLGSAAVLFVLAGLAGSSVAHHLSTGGFDDTGSQAPRAAATLDRIFHQGSPDVALLVKARHGTVDDPAVAAAGTELTRQLAAQPGVEQATSYWSLDRVPPLRSGDRTMPEEINRIITDAIADALWTPRPTPTPICCARGLGQTRSTGSGTS